MPFKTYDFKLRLGGSVLNEIRINGAIAPSVMMYRALHGSDSVVDLKERGERLLSQRQARAEVMSTFFNPALDNPQSVKVKNEIFRNLFGHDTNPLPEHLDLDDSAEEEDIEIPDPEEIAASEDAAPKAEDIPMAGRRRMARSPTFAE